MPPSATSPPGVAGDRVDAAELVERRADQAQRAGRSVEVDLAVVAEHQVVAVGAAGRRNRAVAVQRVACDAAEDHVAVRVARDRVDAAGRLAKVSRLDLHDRAALRTARDLDQQLSGVAGERDVGVVADQDVGAVGRAVRCGRVVAVDRVAAGAADRDIAAATARDRVGRAGVVGVGVDQVERRRIAVAVGEEVD